MIKRVRIGILGCAGVARRYAISAFQSIENAEVVCIASRDYEKAKEWALEFNIKAEESYDSLIKNRGVDAVYIPLPIGLHKEWILKAVKEGKHIICEKSLASNFYDVKEIVEECKKNKIVLYENFMCDFHPQHQKVLSMIKEGNIGKPFVFRGYFGFPMKDKDNIRYNKDLGGGSLNDAGAYTIFMARKILGNEPISVNANLYFDKEKNIDMRGLAQIDFGEGVGALLAFNFDAVYQGNYSVWGSNGIINVNRAYSIPPDEKPDVEFIANENLKEIKTNIDVECANHFELIFHDFCNTILNKKVESKKIKYIYKKIIDQAKVLEAVRVSADEGRRVLLSEIV